MCKGRLARGSSLRGSRQPERGRRARSLLGLGMSAVLAAMVLVSTAGADHGVVELVSGGSGSNGTFDVSFEGASQDGTRIFFSTEESLVGHDNDTPCTDIFGTPAPCRDIYQYNGGVTSLLSRGPIGGNGPFGASFDAVSQDGSRVYFSTREALVAADQDPADGCLDVSGAPSPCRDIYVRTGGSTTTLVSTGPAGGNGDEDVEFNAISRDGGRVFFTTQESLVAGDTDRELDVYTHKDGVTRRISAGVGARGNGEPDATFEGASGDGTRVFFSTDEALTPDDADCADANCNEDVYERRGVSTTTLISKGPAGTGADLDSQFEGTSRDGTRVFFSTREALVPADVDPIAGCESRGLPAPCRDIYEYSAGTTSLVSGGDGAFDASFDATTEDGSRVYFGTREGLVDADRDAPAAGDPGCGSDTAPAPCRDIYERADGASGPRLISIGPTGGTGPYEASFDAVSQDGSRVFFGTEEALVPADRDPADACSDSSGNPTPCRDIYERRDGTTTLISTGPAGGDGAFDASFDGISQDGTRAFFSTDEALTSSDTDPPGACTDSSGDPSSCRDVYERSGFATTLISQGPIGGDGAFNASFDGSALDGTRVFFTTAEALVGGDGDGSVDLYTARPGADLSLSMSDSPDPAITGQTLTYTLVVENHGALDTGGVRVTDSLPAGVSFQSASASQGSCAESAGTITCNLGDLANGAQATVEVRVTPQTTGVFTNFASVQASQGDPSNANNSASVATTVNSPTPPPPPPAPAGGGGAPAVAAGAGPPVPPAAVKDTVAPALAVFSRSKSKLARVLSKGLRVTVRCLEACRVQLALELDRKTARRLKLSSKVGRGSARLAAGESERVTVRLTGKAKRRLARSSSKVGRRIKLRLRTTASDAAGNDRTVRGKVTLER